ncbi:MAG TPA: hypothetical protein VHS31_02065 [Tepidisphaeraceae bacterium]|nr:hypothetical protein [Tepidisphaeraceae bacterium]
MLKQDPKKATTLAVLVAVLLAMWGKLALSGGSGTPKPAAAMTPAPLAPPVALGSNNKTKPEDTGELLREWVSEPMPQTVSRNIFEVKLDYYPMESNAKASNDSRTIEDPTFWDRLAKSIDAQADQQHKREILIQNLRQQAGQLQLTMAMMGTNPKAMINGQMVGEGEVVAQFRVLRIEARSVVVEREGIKLEIPMK